MAFNGTGSNVTSLNAANFSSGTVATARLASGTANSTTFLRGDQTWATAGGGALTDNTLQTITSTTTTTIDLDSGNVASITMASDITTLSFSNVPASGTPVQLVLVFKNAADGTAYNVTWPASIYWNSTTGAGGSLIGPTLTTGPNSLTTISLLTTDGGTKWEGWVETTIPGQSAGNKLFTWGNNGYGQLGLNVPTTSYYYSPEQVGLLSNWAQISASLRDCAAIKTDGTLWTWGSNANGVLGLNSSPGRSSPVQVGSLTNWAQVSMDRTSCAAVKTDGTLWTWGLNTDGQLGHNNLTNLSSPVQVGSLTTWARGEMGSYAFAGITTAGTLFTCGSNSNGILGQNDTIARSSPTQVGSNTNWAQVTISDVFCVARTTAGTLFSWGYNGSGALGINVAPGVGANRSSPTQIGALTDWADVNAKSRTCVAVKTNGTLWTWGSNGSGQLGQNDTVDRSSPVQVGALTDWSKATMFSSCAAVKTNGALWTWGRNSYGQLGQNNTIFRSSPVQVGSLTTWGQVDMAAYSCAGLQTSPAINPS